MFRPHYGICICHGLKRLIVVKKGYCYEGNNNAKRTSGGSRTGNVDEVKTRPSFRPKKNSSSIKKTKAIQRSRKPTGEKKIFEEIIEERGAKSQISGQTLHGNFNPGWFSHILSKGAYPAFRLYKKNIVLKTWGEHHLWETQKHKLKELPEWKWIFDLEQELKQEYYAENNARNELL